MGFYAYCRNCEHPLDAPKFPDAVIGEQRCPKCDEPRVLNDWERRVALEECQEVLYKVVTALAVHADFHNIDRSAWDDLAVRFAP